MSATYINGFVKDQSLRNFEDDEIMTQFNVLWNSLGRRALKHNTLEVSNEIKSIQGKWTDSLWNKYPKHEMEIKQDPPEFKEFEPAKKTVDKLKVKVHQTTKVLRTKPSIQTHGLQH